MVFATTHKYEGKHLEPGPPTWNACAIMGKHPPLSSERGKNSDPSLQALNLSGDEGRRAISPVLEGAKVVLWERQSERRKEAQMIFKTCTNTLVGHLINK